MYKIITHLLSYIDFRIIITTFVPQAYRYHAIETN